MLLQRTLFLFLHLFLLNHSTYCQIKIDSTFTDYNVRYKKENDSLSIGFYKDRESSSFSTLRIKDQTLSVKGTLNLEDEIKIIDSLWKEAERHIPINLTTIHMGYPSLYSDVLKRQITIFSKSQSWQNHVKKNGKKLDLKLMREIMLKDKTYLLIDSLLEKRGYRIKEISTEKHGFVSKDALIKAGFTGKEIIPIPFMVYLSVERKK
jgi:hypothetical protein